MTETRNISTSHPSRFRLVFPFLDFLSPTEKGEDLILYCSEAQLPGITLDVIPIETPYFDLKEPSNKINFDDLILTYSIDELFTNYTLILNWLQYIKNPERYEVKNQKVDATLMIYSNNNNPKVQVTFKNIFPIAIEPINFDKKIDDIEDLENTVTFAVESFFIRED